MNDWLLDLFHLVKTHEVRKVVITFKDGTKDYFNISSPNEFQYGRDGDIPTHVVIK